MAVTKTDKVATATSAKPKYTKKAKSTRRNAKGWMDGKRESVFLPLLPVYAAARARGWQHGEATLKDFVNLYDFHFPWPMSEFEEPDELKEYDPTAEKPKVKRTPAEDVQRREHIKVITDRLRRWMIYRVTPKKRKADASAAPPPKRDAANTFEMFMGRLLGLQHPPRQRHAAYAFMDDHWTQGMNVKKTFDDAWDALPEKGPHIMVNLRSKVVREVFQTLPETERKRYQEQVKEEGDKAKEAYKAMIEAGPQRDPVSRATAVANVKNFLLEVNKGIEERTALRTFTIYGGPMGQYDGQTGTFNVCISGNNDTVPLTFAEWWGKDKMSAFVEDFKKYLATCYNDEQRAEVLLPEMSALRQRNLKMTDITTNATATSSDTLATNIAPTGTNPPATSVKLPDTSNLIPFADDTQSKVGASPNEAQQSAVAVVKKPIPKATFDSDDDSDSDDDKDPANPKPWESDKSSEESGSEDGSGDSGSESDDDIVPKAKTTRKPQPAPKLSAYEVQRNAQIRSNRLAVAGLDYMQKGAPLGTVLPVLSAEGYRKIALDAIARGDMEDLKEKENYEAPKPRPRPTPTLKKKDNSAPLRKSSRLGYPQADAPNSSLLKDIVNIPTSSKDVVNGEVPAGQPNIDGGLQKDVEMTTAEVEKVGEGDKVSGPMINGAGDEDVEMGVEAEEETPGMDMARKDVTMEEAEPMVGAKAVNMTPSPAQTPRPPPPSPPTPAKLFDDVRYQSLRTTAPDWLADALKEFDVASGQKHLRELFLLLLEIESGYKSRTPKEKHLPAQKRPGMLSRWIGGGRTGRLERQELKEKEISKFVAAFHGWWDLMQPSWRSRDVEGKWEMEMYGADWQKLDCGGVNGFLSVVACLSWWASACAQGKCELSELEKVVVDVKWVMEGLHGYVNSASEV
ncbi:hypothetical protein BDZ89DRAFT_1050173 [Hymenopellis radicata]|nr:hypothetical protein BDZ89DRAFT_1050173 [Hymenopellis radicata]